MVAGAIMPGIKKVLNTDALDHIFVMLLMMPVLSYNAVMGVYAMKVSKTLLTVVVNNSLFQSHIFKGILLLLVNFVP